jgi:hypothetical protein
MKIQARTLKSAMCEDDEKILLDSLTLKLFIFLRYNLLDD